MRSGVLCNKIHNFTDMLTAPVDFDCVHHRHKTSAEAKLLLIFRILEPNIQGEFDGLIMSIIFECTEAIRAPACRGRNLLAFSCRQPQNIKCELHASALILQRLIICRTVQTICKKEQFASAPQLFTILVRHSCATIICQAFINQRPIYVKRRNCLFSILTNIECRCSQFIIREFNTIPDEPRIVPCIRRT